MDLIWFYLSVILTIGMFFLVPTERVIELLPFGLVGGFGVAVIVQYLAVDLFNLWQFKAELLSIKGIPVGILLSWIPPVIIFGHFWRELGSNLERGAYILGFAVATTIMEYVFVVTGYRKYLYWNVYLTFLLAVVIHIGLGYYLAVASRQRIDNY
ncbi:hypothetical protein JCM16358_06840 [Halanaerocella petrolearia]